MSTQTARRLGIALVGLTASIASTASAASVTRGPELAEPALADIAFMAGTWHATSNGDDLEEHFSPPRDGSMVGMFRWMSGGSTAFTEHIVIEQRADGVHLFLRHFSPGSVPWEKEAEGPLTMRLTQARGGRAVFENTEIPFPTRIIYHRTHPERLAVRLEGRREDGTAREMQFNFRSTDMTTSTQTLTDAGQSIGYDGGLTLAFHVKDMAASMDWYQNVLGFKLMYKLEEMGWCELTTSVDKVMIGLSQVEHPKVGGPTPTFGVKDIDHARSRLEDQGVRFDGPTQEIPGMVKLATFFDPDGNSLMLSQSLSDQAP